MCTLYKNVGGGGGGIDRLKLTDDEQWRSMVRLLTKDIYLVPGRRMIFRGTTNCALSM